MKIETLRDIQMNNDKNFKKVWLSFVEIYPQKGYSFDDLIEHRSKTNYIGAWCNCIVQAEDIKEALEVIYSGFRELDFKVSFIDKVENLGSLIEYGEASAELISDSEYLINSEYVFKIHKNLFPFEEE